MPTSSQLASATPVAVAAKAPPTRRRSLADLFATDLRALPVVIGLIALGVFFSFENSIFLSPRNLSNLVIQSTVTGILALGLTFVLLVKEIDLSIAAISGVTSVLMAKLIVDFGVPVWAAILISMAFGALLATASARWVTWIGVPSFVVTLGLGLALNGLQLMLLPSTGRYSLLGTGVEKIAGTSIAGVWAWVILAIGLGVFALISAWNFIQRQRAGLEASAIRLLIAPVGVAAVTGVLVVAILEQHQGVPVIAVIFAVLLALASYVVNSTQFGLYLFAVGNSDEAARRAGVNVARIKMAAFAISGAVAALAGTIAASRILGVSVSSGGGIGGGALLLESIAAAVIGGVSLFGGRGQVSAALLGALIIGTVSNGLNLMGVENEVRLIVTGLLLVLAVSIDRIIERLAGPGIG
jgi:D-xylose transport system permease protein